MPENKLQSLTDEQLVLEKLRGNEAAFELLVQRYLSPIYNFVFKYVHTVEQAEDVTQEAFLKIWRNLRKFDRSRKFKSWAFTIAKNTALDHLKKKGLVAFTELEFETQADFETRDFAASLVSEAMLPDQAMERIEQITMISHALSKLPSAQQEVINLYYRRDLNFREIAEFLKESINTVKTRHRRALLFLKKYLGSK